MTKKKKKNKNSKVQKKVCYINANIISENVFGSLLKTISVVTKAD